MSNDKSQNFNLNSYIERLATTYPSIKSIWLIGSRANNSFREDSDWDLLVFATSEILNQLKYDTEFSYDKVDLLVVYNGDNFECPWDVSGRFGNLKSGSLRDWKWKDLNCNRAQYESTGEKIFDNYDDFVDGAYTPTRKVLKAEKLWPKYCP